MTKQSTRSKPSGGTKHVRKKSSARQATSGPHAAANRRSGAQRSLEPLGKVGANKDREDRGANDERESLVNDRRRGTKYEITPKVEEVAAIHGFMNDLDCKTLDPAVVGRECVESAEALYRQHVQLWLNRDPVLAKADVRDTGGGLHTILWLDEPIVVATGEAQIWDDIARGICNALPGDPNLNGIIALTRPVGALNTKYSPPREVRLLRPGEPITRAEILDLSRQTAEQPARLWMRMFFGGERVEPCPFCGKESLGVAGSWQVRCYTCGRVNAASLVYRFYSPEFLDSRMEAHHG
jgi:hypothetical protein